MPFGMGPSGRRARVQILFVQLFVAPRAGTWIETGIKKGPPFPGSLRGGEDKSLSPFLTEKRADNAEKCGSNQRSAYLFISIKNQKYPTDSEYKADGEGHP